VTNAEVFRPRSNLVYAISIFIFSVGITGSYLYDSSFETRISALLFNLLFCYTAFLLFIRPKVTLFDEGIIVTNPFHEFTIGWGDIDSIEARYTMYLLMGSQKIHAWAAPAPGRYHARSVHPNELKGMSIPDLHNMRPGESPRTHSGVATYLARTRHERFRNSNVSAIAFSKEVDTRAIVALCVLVMLSVATLVV
jgi:hypothetical protein